MFCNKKLFNLVYILQLYEYEVGPFTRWLQSHSRWYDLCNKGKLKFTVKVNLIILLTYLLAFLSFIIIVLLLLSVFSIELFLLSTLFLFLEFYKLLPVFIITSLVALMPVEIVVRIFYVCLAILKRNKCRGVKVIGIAGSYSKTSMKEFLATILSERFKALKTPGNINTLIGIARFIIKKLKPEYDIFIVEIGAYKIGDIKRASKLVKPSIGILTGINEAHLERFGSLTNTIKAKFEIVESISEDGISLINYDDVNIKNALDAHTLKSKIVCYSLEKQHDGFMISNARTSESGTSFQICKAGEWDMAIDLPVLGMHNVRSILGCIILCDLMGMTKQEIQRGVQNIKAVEHRLAPIYNMESDILVIDDTYNANSDGIKCALDVLATFKNRRKIIVAQGVIESGTQSEKLNMEVGEAMANVVDLAILIKSGISDYILNGLLGASFERDRILIFDTFKEMEQSLPSITSAGDVILFQNDLPDQYA